MYDRRVSEAADILIERLEGGSSDQLWAEAKKEYIALLVDHKQPELAETFFNSVSTKVLAKEYFNNRFIFVKPAASTEFIDSDPPVFCTFYPANAVCAAACNGYCGISAGRYRLPTPPPT